MLIGNVGKEPELKHTPSGIPVISFRLATSETWKDRDGKVREHTDWHTVVAWRGLAEVIQKLVNKGSRIYVEGKIQTRNFDDKGGQRKHVVEIIADNMLLLEQRRSDDEVDDFGDTSDGGDLIYNEFDDISEGDEKNKTIDTFLF
jgi:single-strand DNA-binding protein